MTNDQTPIYVNLYGGGGLQPEEPVEPLIKRCWFGREKLWIVFWAYGVFGTGGILAACLAMIFIGLQIGLLFAPQDTQGGYYGALTGMAGGAALAIPYLVWMTVSLWRCAPNCITKYWGHVVRVWLILQWMGMIYLVYKYAPLIKW